MVREDVPPASRNSVDRRGQQDGEGQRKMNWTPRSNSGAEAGCKVLLSSSSLLRPYTSFGAEQLHLCSGEPWLHVDSIIAAHRSS